MICLVRLGAQKWFIMIVGLLSGCGMGHGNRLEPDGSRAHPYPERTSVHISVALDSDGTLWRVAAGRRHVYVDRSTDLGRTFVPPVAVNTEPQRIKVDGENRPDIAVDRRGRIYVSYTAEAERPTTLFVSVSADAGRHFSNPVPVSDKATQASSFQGRLRRSPDDRVHLFWHDERDRTAEDESGNALYFTTLGGESGIVAPTRKVADTQCECCRPAIDFDAAGRPVVFTRFIYPGDIRDHGLIKPQVDGKTWLATRVTFDEWEFVGCPEQGPALAIDANGRYHTAWFTLGTRRQGVFYANSSDQGHHFGPPMPVGNLKRQAGHPDLITLGTRVFLVWREFDGEYTQLLVMRSADGGRTWTQPESLARSAARADNPLLLSDGRKAFVSWNSSDRGYQMIPIN